MKQVARPDNAPRQPSGASRRADSPPRAGASIAPPSYGIEFVDRGMPAAAGPAARLASTIQCKLLVGPAADPDEREADLAARAVVARLRDTPPPPAEAIGPARPPGRSAEDPASRPSPAAEVVARQALPDRPEPPPPPSVQPREVEGIAAPPDVEAPIREARGAGRPLEPGLRGPMERAFGSGFGGVRVHTDARADALNRSLHSRAFAIGRDLFFRGGEYRPGSPGGRELIAHELAHVVQQRGVVQRALSDDPTEEQKQDTVKEIEVGIVYKIASAQKKKVHATREGKFGQYDICEYVLDPVDGEAQGASRKTVRSHESSRYFFSSDPIGQEKESELRRARAALQKGEGGYTHGEALFPGKTLGEGTFPYVAQYLYDSVSDADVKEAIWRRVGELGDEAPAQEKTEILSALLARAYVPFEKTLTPEEINRLAAKDVKDFDELYRIYAIQTSDASELQGLTSVGVGFHATKTGPDVVKDKPAAEGGWEGIKKGTEVAFFRRRYALDEPWNPLSAYFEKNRANFRLGKNKDNDLISTASVAVRLYPALKFPFPEKTKRMQGTTAYAVLVKRAYPTFVKQRSLGEDKPFQEIAVDKVPPNDIIGYAFVSRYYPGGKDDEDRAAYATEFDFKVFDFIPNYRFEMEYSESLRSRLIAVARAEVERLKSDGWRRWKA